MNHLGLIIALPIALILNGCSALNQDELSCSDQTQHHHKSFVLPKDLKSDIVKNNYPIPKASSSHIINERSLLPPGSSLAK
jgi:uncharacterized lipoprotein